jgi:hypothetical protein
MNTFTKSLPLFRRAIIYLILATFSVGCTAMSPLPAADRGTVMAQVAVGDEIEVTRKDGQVLHFTVIRIDESGISGRGKFVAYADIQSVRIVHLETGKTLLVVVGFVVLLFGAIGYSEWH